MLELNRVKDILDAIRSVKSRCKRALEAQNFVEYTKLMGDLADLQCCLTYECEILEKIELKLVS